MEEAVEGWDNYFLEKMPFVLTVSFLLLQECKTWLNMAMSMEEDGQESEEVQRCLSSALKCSREAKDSQLQVRIGFMSDASFHVSPVLYPWFLLSFRRGKSSASSL